MLQKFQLIFFKSSIISHDIFFSLEISKFHYNKQLELDHGGEKKFVSIYNKLNQSTNRT